MEVVFALPAIAGLILLVWLGTSNHRSFLLNLLVLAMLLGSRLPLGTLHGSQRADIRIDDLIILGMFLSAFLLIMRGRARLHYPRYMLFLSLFLISSLVSSLLASIRFGFSLIFSTLFFLRLFEFAVLAYIVPLFIVKEKDMETLYKCFLAACGINILWLLIQISTDWKGPLIKLAEIPHYGYTLLGTSQPLAVSGIFLLSFTAFTAHYLLLRKKIFILLLLFGSSAGILLSLSRTGMVGMVASLMILIFLIFCSNRLTPARIFHLGIVFFILSSMCVVVIGSFELLPIPAYRLEWGFVGRSLEIVRVSDIWIPLWRKFLENYVWGYGTGNIGYIHNIFDEAHNYYLRVLIEDGVVGFVMFGIFCMGLGYTLLKSYLRKLPVEHHYVFLFAILWFTATGIMCLGQDALHAREIAVPSFILIGLVNYLVSNQKALQSRLKDRPWTFT